LLKKISIAEPVTDLKRIKIIDNDEPLVDFLELCPQLVQANRFFDYRYETVVRESVAQMLCTAANAVHKGYRIGVLEGWRPHHIQRRMYLRAWNQYKTAHPDWSDTKLKRSVNKFVAPLNDKVPPPHSTGGAVDIFLLDRDGVEQNLREPYEPLNNTSFPFEAEGLSQAAMDGRRILADALLEGGLTNYPSEYWHWSYGDQGWAYRTGADYALYGVTEPENYVADPRDVHDGPIVQVDR
jgi:D-alanyl-D-alanine dipeptidase